MCRFLRALHIEDITGARGDRVAVFPVGRRKADTVGELTAVLRQLLRAVGRIDRRVAAHDHAHVVLAPVSVAADGAVELCCVERDIIRLCQHEQILHRQGTERLRRVELRLQGDRLGQRRLAG